MQINVKNRRTEISLMSILMCLAVIFIHITSWTLPNMDRQSPKYLALLFPWRLSAFVVQGFIFLSGVRLFIGNGEKVYNYGKFIFGRIKKILLPYLLWVLIYYAYFIIIGWYKFSFSDLLEYVFLGTLCSHFYFVVIIMQFYLLMPLWRWLVSKVDPPILIAVSTVITASVKLFVSFKYDDRVFFTYLCYFIIGAVVGKNYDKAKAALVKWRIAIILSFSVLALLDLYFTYRSSVLGIAFAQFELLHLCYSLSAIFFLWQFCTFISARQKATSKLLFLCDKSSYLIYLSHVLFIYVANDLIYRMGINNMLSSYLIRFVFTYVTVFLFSLSYTYIKEWLYVRYKNGRGRN